MDLIHKLVVQREFIKQALDSINTIEHSSDPTKHIADAQENLNRAINGVETVYKELRKLEKEGKI